MAKTISPELKLAYDSLTNEYKLRQAISRQNIKAAVLARQYFEATGDPRFKEILSCLTNGDYLSSTGKDNGASGSSSVGSSI
jgi:hypothetical protein